MAKILNVITENAERGVIDLEEVVWVNETYTPNIIEINFKNGSTKRYEIDFDEFLKLLIDKLGFLSV